MGKYIYFGFKDLRHIGYDHNKIGNLLNNIEVVRIDLFLCTASAVNMSIYINVYAVALRNQAHKNPKKLLKG